MKKIAITLGIATLGLTSCNQFKQGEGDLQYKIITDKGGDKIEIGDFVVLNLIEKTEGDSVLFSSYDAGQEIMMNRQKSLFKGDVFSGLSHLSEGDSAVFKINADSMATKMGRHKPTNNKDKYFVYTLKIDKVIPKGKLTDSLFNEKIESYFKAENEKAKNGEAGKLESYIKGKNLKPITTPSGLQYVITTEGTGTKASAGDTLEVNYTGKFLDDKIFDTSVEELAKKSGTYNQMRPYKPMKVAAGSGMTIPGFDEALLLFPAGTKVTLILPSKLAYGEQGAQRIKPYSPLVFDLEFVKIIPKPAGTPTPTPKKPAQK